MLDSIKYSLMWAGQKAGEFALNQVKTRAVDFFHEVVQSASQEATPMNRQVQLVNEANDDSNDLFPKNLRKIMGAAAVVLSIKYCVDKFTQRSVVKTAAMHKSLVPSLNAPLKLAIQIAMVYVLFNITRNLDGSSEEDVPKSVSRKPEDTKKEDPWGLTADYKQLNQDLATLGEKFRSRQT